MDITYYKDTDYEIRIKFPDKYLINKCRLFISGNDDEYFIGKIEAENYFQLIIFEFIYYKKDDCFLINKPFNKKVKFIEETCNLFSFCKNKEVTFIIKKIIRETINL